MSATGTHSSLEAVSYKTYILKPTHKGLQRNATQKATCNKESSEKPTMEKEL